MKQKYVYVVRECGDGVRGVFEKRADAAKIVKDYNKDVRLHCYDEGSFVYEKMPFFPSVKQVAKV